MEMNKRYTNLNYLKEVTGGEDAIIREFIEMFFEQIIEFRIGLRHHLEQKEYAELGALAHKAKSSVMTFGLNDLGKQLKELQLNTQKLKAIDSYEASVTEFERVITIAESELTEELDRLKDEH